MFVVFIANYGISVRIVRLMACTPCLGTPTVPPANVAYSFAWDLNERFHRPASSPLAPELNRFDLSLIRQFLRRAPPPPSYLIDHFDVQHAWSRQKHAPPDPFHNEDPTTRCQDTRI